MNLDICSYVRITSLEIQFGKLIIYTLCFLRLTLFSNHDLETHVACIYDFLRWLLTFNYNFM